MLYLAKWLAIVAMFFVALAPSAQVTTSTMSGAVTDECQKTVNCTAITVLYTPSGTKYKAMTNMDGRYDIQGKPPGCSYYSDEIHPQVNAEDGDISVVLVAILAFIAIVLLSIVFIIALFKGKNIKIKYSDFGIEIASKAEDLE